MGETIRRILSAIVMVPLYISLFAYSGLGFLHMYVVATIFSVIALREFYDFADRGEEGKPFRLTGTIATIVIITACFLQIFVKQTEFPPGEFVIKISTMMNGILLNHLGVFFFLFCILFALQIVKRPLNGAIFSVSSTIVGVIYIGFTLGHFFLLLAEPNRVYLFFLVSGITFLTDSGAYFGGRWFGRHPAGLKISPKKTWEGYVSGIVTSIVYVYVLNWIWGYTGGQSQNFGLIESAFIAILFSIISILGDLSESAMKRDAKIKDSSSVIPGHGGVLDLADALLITVPSLYYYLLIRGLLISG